jgi:hypothetical protein
MTFSPKVRVRARVRLRPKWDDEDGECACDPLWMQLLVALAPVVATGGLELYIDRRKAADRAERKRQDAIDRALAKDRAE